MQTNANSMLLTAILAASKKGSFTGLITKKVGVVRGRGTAKQTYGDDTVHTVIITGFNYLDLVRKSLVTLKTLTPEAIEAECAAKGKTDKDGKAITASDVLTAMAELEDSFNATLNGTNESTTDAVYEPLVKDNETVVGGRVYRCTGLANCKCRTCSGDEKAPLDGTIFVQGLKIHESIVTPAVNGPAPKPASSAKTVAKNAVTAHLPTRRYVSYRLEPGKDFILRAGGVAEIEAMKGGFKVTDDILKIVA